MTDPAALHETVLLQETLDWLRPEPGKRYLDGTAGMGGHSLGILQAADGTTVLSLDRDADAVELAKQRLASFGERSVVMHLAFSRFELALEDLDWQGVDGVVLDLGVSSMQLDTPERGFSFHKAGPLDMRMDTGSGRPPARTLVNRSSFSDLKFIIGRYGDEPMAGRIARAILAEREKEEITDTARLASIVEQAYPAKWRRQARNHPATRTFMALRIAVNKELEELELFLERIADYMNPGARIVVISFHSLEDRAVKQAFRREAKGCICPPQQVHCTCNREPMFKILTKKPQIPTEEEMERNARSRSAKLRAAERIGGREAAHER